MEGSGHELHRAEEKSPRSASSCLAALLRLPLTSEGRIGGLKLLVSWAVVLLSLVCLVCRTVLGGPQMFCGRSGGVGRTQEPT